MWNFLGRTTNSLVVSAEEFIEEYITDIRDLGEFKEARIKLSFAGKSDNTPVILNDSEESRDKSAPALTKLEFSFR